MPSYAPSYALDYGVWDATSDELLDSYGWSNMGVAWLWFALPLGLLVRPWQAAGREAFRRHAFDAAYATLCGLAILVSATLANRGLGYSTIVLYTAYRARHGHNPCPVATGLDGGATASCSARSS